MSDAASRPSPPSEPASIGPYTVVGQLGRGGMGTVYRGRDSRLRRDVAIKMLSEERRPDAARVARFVQEARVLAALTHPNIAAIYGMEESVDGAQALVLELVEGQTLGSRLAAGAVPFAEALTIARQVAEALEAAHEKGIVHRDLKPANIAIAPTGLVKVLDFGVAKMVEPPEMAVDDTKTSGVTGEGMVVGTAAYMSPEQARGQAVDKRTDIWAFGCVLYEMLTGRRLFQGNSTTDTLAAVLTADPDWSKLPSQVPSAVRALLQRCLERERLKRLGDVSAIRFALDNVAALSTADRPVAANASASSGGPAWLRWGIPAAAALIVGALAIGLTFRGEGTGLNPWEQLDITPPPEGRFDLGVATQGGMAISPDGRTLAFVAMVDGVSSLWVRQPDGIFRRIEGTRGAQRPFWSPDSKNIGYFAFDVLYRVPAAGGGPTEVAKAPPGNTGLPMSGSWTDDQKILFFHGGSGIFIVPDNGGEPPKQVRSSGGFPQALPGGNFLFFLLNRKQDGDVSDVQDSGIYAAPLSDPEKSTLVVSADGPGVYASGYLLWGDGSALRAQAFDPASLTKRGQPQKLLDRIAFGVLKDPLLTVSTTGRLIYSEEHSNNGQLTWLRRDTGRRSGLLGEPGMYQGFRFFNNGRVMVQDGSRDSGGLWLVEEGRASTKTISVPVIIPVPTADQKSVVYGTYKDGLYRSALDGSGRSLIPTNTTAFQFPSDLDGDILLFTIASKASKNDIWWQRVSSDGSPAPGAKPRPYLQTGAMEYSARFAPGQHHKWVAYMSDDSKQDEVYVNSFPEPGERQRISEGGRFPVWGPETREGRELYYTSLNNKVMVAYIKFGPTSITPSLARELFDLPPETSLVATSPFETFDGQRFLVRAPVAAAYRPLKILNDWPAKLLKR